jgi:hypothetical protein
MTTMLEKMARAAAMTVVGDLPHGETTAEGLWEWMSDDQRDKMIAIARAALEAIREPSEAIASVAVYDEYDWAARNFTAMIDAILNETPDPQSASVLTMDMLVRKVLEIREINMMIREKLGGETKE